MATILGLSKRVGNWLSAAPGDDEFMSLLDEDEFNIIRRRGLVDLLSFNKRWRKEIRLYANGKPTVFKDKDADKVLEQLNQFTAIMVCIVAALDTFTTFSATRTILSNVLKELLRPSAIGEEILATQYPNRLNSWRSLSCLRSFLIEAGEVRQNYWRKALFLRASCPLASRKIWKSSCSGFSQV